MLTLGDLWRKVINSEATAECFGSSPGGERSLLSWAERGEEEMVQTLADRGAAVDPDDVSDHTPLGWAVCGGNLALLNLLLDKGAGVDVRNSQFTTLKSTPRISLSFFGTEQLPPWPELD